MPRLYSSPEVYAAVFSEMNREQLRFLASVFGKYRPGRVQRVLEPACGNGRLALPLARAGYEVTGYDLSARALRYATAKARREKVAWATFRRGDLRTFTLPDRFDAAYCLTCTLNELPTMADLRRHLRNVRQMLAPGGLYVFDVVYRLPDGPHAAGRCMLAGREIEWRADVEPARGRLARWAQWLTYTIDGQPFAPVVLRHRQPAAVAAAIKAAGLRVLARFDGYSLRPAPRGAPAATYVCRR